MIQRGTLKSGGYSAQLLQQEQIPVVQGKRNLDVVVLMGTHGSKLSTKWLDLGHQLLPDDLTCRIDQIKRDHPRDSQNACRAMLTFWRNACPDECTVEALIEGLKAVGFQVLAGKILKDAGKYIEKPESAQSEATAAPDRIPLHQLLPVMEGFTQIETLGDQLIGGSKTEEIKKNYPLDVADQLRGILTQWYRQKSGSLSKLLSELRSPGLRQNALAAKLEKKFQNELAKVAPADSAGKVQESAAELQELKQLLAERDKQLKESTATIQQLEAKVEELQRQLFTLQT